MCLKVCEGKLGGVVCRHLPRERDPGSCLRSTHYLNDTRRAPARGACATGLLPLRKAEPFATWIDAAISTSINSQ
jgi:hypothetical protein